MDFENVATGAFYGLESYDVVIFASFDLSFEVARNFFGLLMCWGGGFACEAVCFYRWTWKVAPLLQCQQDKKSNPLGTQLGLC